jgi:hypothetical protein
MMNSTGKPVGLIKGRRINDCVRVENDQIGCVPGYQKASVFKSETGRRKGRYFSDSL